ncbi:MAG: hypothetical protein H0T42_27245 [Deltaproteobacteria bacterium]|nr:hypothetical protein [Deltaproteobacteria bacterium]
MENAKVIVELSSDQALVLYDWLARFNAARSHAFEDQAEQRVLWDLECTLESMLAAPLASNHDELLAAARARIRDPNEANR